MPNDLNLVVSDILKVLGIIVDKKTNNLQYGYNINCKNFLNVTCDDKQMILINDKRSVLGEKEEQSVLIFRLLDKEEESCSCLIANDSINFYLRYIICILFDKIFRIKNRTPITEGVYYGKTRLDELENPTKNTKYKFDNLFKIVTATFSSHHLISFSIDLNNYPKEDNEAKVDFKYPLYDALSEIENNIIYGIYLEDFEIKLFKQIYDKFIIDIIDNLFKDVINIPKNSSNYPQFYMLLKIKLMLEEAFSGKYKIYLIRSIEYKVLKYSKMASNLNRLTDIVSFDTEHLQKLDQQSYRNELVKRKESEPNWLLLKDSTFRQPIVRDSPKLQKYWANEREENSIQLNENNKRWEKENDSREYMSHIIREHNNLIKSINQNSTTPRLWQNDTEFFYITKLNNEEKGNKDKISKLISSDLKNDILIVEDIRQIEKIKNKKDSYGYHPFYLLVNRIPKIHEYFSPNKHESDSSNYKNKFEYTKYLSVDKGKSVSSMIDDFIRNLTNTTDEYNYIINWLAYFFHTLSKTNNALVLIGDNEVSEDIFFREIIKPIFGSKFCKTIDDDMIREHAVAEIIEETIFYHFTELPSETRKLKKTKNILRDILIRNTIEVGSTLKEIHIYGQTLITLESDNTYLRDIKSKCSIIKMKPLETILDKMGYMDSTSLCEDIGKDLLNFSYVLKNYYVDNDLARTILKPSSDQSELENMDKKLDNFIRAIKNHHDNMEYFDKIKDKEPELYDELIHNFQENMIARQLLANYFDIIHGESIFSNKEILETLKSKDNFFAQNIDKNSQYKKKKRYQLPKRKEDN